MAAADTAADMDQRAAATRLHRMVDLPTAVNRLHTAAVRRLTPLHRTARLKNRRTTALRTQLHLHIRLRLLTAALRTRRHLHTRPRPRMAAWIHLHTAALRTRPHLHIQLHRLTQLRLHTVAWIHLHMAALHTQLHLPTRLHHLMVDHRMARAPHRTVDRHMAADRRIRF